MPTGFVFLSIWGVVALAAAIVIAVHDAKDRREEDVIASGLTGLLFGALWPLWLVVLPLGWLGTRIARFFR